MIDNDTRYNITMKAEPELDYHDGFADGYSRAWQECWEYFRTLSAPINNESSQKTDEQKDKNAE